MEHAKANCPGAMVNWRVGSVCQLIPDCGREQYQGQLVDAQSKAEQSRAKPSRAQHSTAQHRTGRDKSSTNYTTIRHFVMPSTSTPKDVCILTEKAAPRCCWRRRSTFRRRLQVGRGEVKRMVEGVSMLFVL